jgi:hypothetical protein
MKSLPLKIANIEAERANTPIAARFMLVNKLEIKSGAEPHLQPAVFSSEPDA